jgi:hypothetical protein
MSSEQFAASHPQGIGQDYWHVARNRILWNRLKHTLRPESQVMDIGCGPGIVVDFLRRKGVRCFGSDLGTPTPETPEVAPYLYLGQSAFELDGAIRERTDTLLFMDVLEHLPDPASFLRESLQAFPRVTTVHLTVPARMEIWSNYDEYFGHFRRYTLPLVAELAADAGLVVGDSAYAFHGLFLAACVSLKLSPKRKTQLSAPTAPLAHALLGALLELEQRLLPNALWGSSIFATLRRRT